MLISGFMIRICVCVFSWKNWWHVCHLMYERKQITGEEKQEKFKGIDLIAKYISLGLLSRMRSILHSDQVN